jgi:hypothetical protein
LRTSTTSGNVSASGMLISSRSLGAEQRARTLSDAA